MNELPRFFTCYPPGIPAARGGFPIQRAGQFNRHKGMSGLFVLEEGFIELPRFLLKWPSYRLNPRGRQYLLSAIGVNGVTVLAGVYHAADSSSDYCVSTRRSSALS